MSEDQPQFRQVSDEEANQFRQDPAHRVNGPARALIAVGCLGIVANIALIAGMTLLSQSGSPVERPEGMDDETFASFERGRQAAPFLNCCGISTATLAVYPLVLAGGFKMQQLQTRWLAILAAVLAMAPCSPAMILGIPIGVWSLIVLNDPIVRTAFAGSSRIKASERLMSVYVFAAAVLWLAYAIFKLVREANTPIARGPGRRAR